MIIERERIEVARLRVIYEQSIIDEVEEWDYCDGYDESAP
jgi:hypothetical protein